MNKKLKTILFLIGVGVFLLAGFVTLGLFFMAEEDRYGDLVYFNQKVDNGDIIFRCKYSPSGQMSDFDEFGIIEKSWGNVYVWGSKYTSKQELYDWAGNGERVKVFRVQDPTFDVSQMKLSGGTYNDLLSSDALEFVVENY